MTLSKAAVEALDDVWEREIVPTLESYIAIPNLSPAFETEWAAAGHMEVATELFRGWAEARSIENMTVEVHRIEGRTPVILIEIPASGGDSDDTVLLYGHLDKQPEMEGWDDDKGPWIPVREGERLYGRGGADDGYAMFASLAAIEALRASGGSHSRLVVLIEASEESGSPDLPSHIDRLADRIGSVSLVICLDSGCADFDRLWVTTSLRGLVGGTLSVEILDEGVHSGSASGVVPSTFRILRTLLSRVEDEMSGMILVPEFHVELPSDVDAQIRASARLVASDLVSGFPFVDGARPMSDDIVQLIVNRTWNPMLSVVGFDGAPSPGSAGNVLRPATRAQLSFRLPPTADPQKAAAAVARVLTADPPHGARVRWTDVETAAGWAAPSLEAWLAGALEDAGQAHFGRSSAFHGEGGSIPFMAMLGERFPDAQFVITGVLGPGSNAHGPNEFLDLDMAKRLTACVADVLEAHATR